MSPTRADTSLFGVGYCACWPGCLDESAEGGVPDEEGLTDNCAGRKSRVIAVVSSPVPAERFVAILPNSAGLIANMLGVCSCCGC